MPAQCGIGHSFETTIGTLSDNVLLEIFFFYKENDEEDEEGPFFLVWNWHLLVHICRRWRQLVYASPRRLDLRILCTRKTPVRKNLDIWPALPISVDFHNFYDYWVHADNEDNAITALEHLDRVFEVRLLVTNWELEKIAMAMREPFPVLRKLHIESEDENAPVLPAKFMGGSAPRLQFINIVGIPFPTLPTLLLSTSDLNILILRELTSTGYISPEALVVALAALPRLKWFTIEFASTRPDHIHPPPPVTRAVLPALTSFLFKGASEYLEDLVSRIDAPQLNAIRTYFWIKLVDFQVVQLSRFIDRSFGSNLTLFKRADVTLDKKVVSFNIYHLTHDRDVPYTTNTISCYEIDYQVSHMAQVLGHFSAVLSNVVHLDLKIGADESPQLDGLDDIDWLLHQFSTVKTLYVIWELAGYVAHALEDITAEMVTEVLPSLDLICLHCRP